MARVDRPVKRLVGEEDHIVHATWSRSGKNMILTVAKDERWNGFAQVLLTPEQSRQLAEFLLDGPNGAG